MANQASGAKLDAEDQAQLSKAFNSGLSQISDFVSHTTDFENLRLADGDDLSTAKATKLHAPRGRRTTYVNAVPLATSAATTDIPSLDGNAQFNIAVKLNSKTTITSRSTSTGMGATARAAWAMWSPTSISS